MATGRRRWSALVRRSVVDRTSRSEPTRCHTSICFDPMGSASPVQRSSTAQTASGGAAESACLRLWMNDDETCDRRGSEPNQASRDLTAFPGVSAVDSCPLTLGKTVTLHAYQGGVTQAVVVPPSDVRRKSVELRRMGWTVIRADTVSQRTDAVA